MAVTREQKDISDWSKGKNGHHASRVTTNGPKTKFGYLSRKSFFGQNAQVRADFG